MENMRHLIKNVEAMYPRINRPYRFDGVNAGKSVPCEAHEDGAAYELQFRMDREQASALLKAMKNAYATVRESDPKKSKGDKAWPEKIKNPFKDEGDGFYTHKAKIKAQYNNQLTRPIAHFDSERNALPEGFELTTGSIVNIACVFIPYNTDMAGAGVSLRLSAVQVLKLAERQQAYNPFEVVEGGFKVQQEEDNPFMEMADEELDAKEEEEEDPFEEPEETPKVKTRKKKAPSSGKDSTDKRALKDVLTKINDLDSDDIDDELADE